MIVLSGHNRGPLFLAIEDQSLLRVRAQSDFVGDREHLTPRHSSRRYVLGSRHQSCSAEGSTANRVRSQSRLTRNGRKDLSLFRKPNSRFRNFNSAATRQAMESMLWPCRNWRDLSEIGLHPFGSFRWLRGIQPLFPSRVGEPLLCRVFIVCKHGALTKDLHAIPGIQDVDYSGAADANG